MFPLRNKQVSGYRFGSKTWYLPWPDRRHVGVDYKANLDDLLAPFNGKIIHALNGKQGGKTIWFKPDHDDVIIRFLHLDVILKGTGTVVKEGERIGITGNTGSITGGPHLHLDISRGSVVLNKNWPANFIDPETYNWGWQSSTELPSVPVTGSTYITVKSPRGVRVRQAPDHNSAMVGSRVLTQGQGFMPVETVTGSDPYGDGRNQWYRNDQNQFAWAGAFA